jgi:predicted Zn-dependent protease
MTQDEAKQIIDKALGCSAAENAEAVVYGGIEESTRFANNVITQNISKSSARLAVRSAYGNKVGMASTNDFSADGIGGVVKRSEEVAKASAPDTEYMPPLPPQKYDAVDGYDQAAAAATPDDRARPINKAAKLCEKSGTKSAGSYLTEGGWFGVGNSKGLSGFHESSTVRFVNTVMTANSSGWYEEISHRLDKVDPMRVTEVALQRAKTAENPIDIEPGDYTVIMEPAAVAEFLAFAAWSMDAKAAHEGHSAFRDKEGKKIAADSVTLYSSPNDADCPGSPFLNDGMKAPTVAWIENGVLKNLIYSRFWAQKTNREPTGWPTNFLMKGGGMTLDEMIAGTDHGLLITRFWYIRFVDPMTLLLTGMTRDGFFLIENGKVTKGVKHMRFNESPLTALMNVEAIGRPQRTGEYVPSYLPALKVRNFTFSSKTTF